VADAVDIPLLHIVDVTAADILAKGQNRVGLLGTRFTMERTFYRDRLLQKHGIDVLIPEEEERKVIHGILYNELCLGEIRRSSRDAFKEIILRLQQRGAEGIILGCTEIPLIVDQEDYDLPLFDTTALHARAAVDEALA
jgi:aspartate racemase